MTQRHKSRCVESVITFIIDGNMYIPEIYTKKCKGLAQLIFKFHE